MSRPALVVLLVLGGIGRAAAEPEEPRKYSTLQEVSFEYLAGVGAAALTVPSMLAAGQAIGQSSSDLSAALVPAILLQLIVPPVAVTLAEWAVGRYGLKGGSRFHPAIWVAVAINLVGIVLGSVGGVWSNDALGNSMYTLTNSLIMPLAVTGVMYAKRKKPRPPPAITPVPPVGELKTGALPAAMTFDLVKVSF